MSEHVQCVERTYDGRSIGGWPCCNPAKKDEDGKMRCGAHSMASQRKRDEKRAARWKATSEASDRRFAIRSAEREVLEACVEEAKAEGLWKNQNAVSAASAYSAAIDVRKERVRRYRALLDGKAEGKEA